ncbi:adhesion G protein-coupled receptor L3-like [Engraulis encrasicolus]|uniref:adhesion G protein-coupled receptor L3-like n=1 Tax=Engraulis encrasicolus TaxID=184585 RepID=UPI002FD3B44B
MNTLLVEHGAEINSRDEIFETSALDKAVEDCHKLPCLRMLLQLGADLNVIFLGIALYKMFHHTAILKPDSGCLDNIKSWVIGAIALLCLLGLTWAFGLMYVNESTVIMAYLFTIFNSLQGMFIFIFHCVLQKKVRKEYGKCLRTHCCSGKSVDTSMGSGKSTASRVPNRYAPGSSQGRLQVVASGGYRHHLITLSHHVSHHNKIC